MKLTKVKVLLFVLSFFIAQAVFAQHPVSIQLTEKDGLPDIEFYDMIEDNKGFMWFACNKGLYRYDGREFKNYSHPKKRGLSVFNLVFDNQNRLWCTNVTGQFFYVENDTLHLDFDASEEHIQSENLHEFAFFNDDLIAFCNNLLFKKNLLNNTIKILDKYNSISKSYYRNSVVKNDTIFILKMKNNKSIVHYLTKKTDNLQQYAQINNGQLAQLYKSRNNIIYQEGQTRNVFKRSLVEKNKISPLKSFGFKDYKFINTVFKEYDAIWFLTEKGAEVFLENKNYDIEKKQHYFPKQFITKVVKDQQSNYWFSTLRNGVFVVPNIHINTYSLNKDIGNITAIENVNNTHIYYGTTLGWIGIYDIKNKTTKYIKSDNDVSRVRHILFNKKFNDVYVATNRSTGSYIIDAETKNVTNSLRGRYFGGAKSMVFLNDGSLFSSLSQDHSLMTFSKGTIETDTIIKLREKRVYKTHYANKEETLYVANVDELIAYDNTMNPTFIRYNNQPIFARGVTQTNDGTIWVSTFKDGVLAIKNNKVVKAYTTKNGLLSNQTSYIQADNHKVWITTENGLQLLNPKTNIFKNLTKQDGIESFNINGIEIINDTIWYSSNLGLFSFDKTKVFKTRKLVNSYITSVTIADSTYTVKRNYTVGYDDKRIKINFNTNGFQSAENTQYQYKLQGLNNDWQNLTKGINEVAFNSLEQGKYSFQLRTIEGEVTSKIQEIKFNVKGVFYKQWWFVSLCALAGLGLVVLYYRRILERQKQKQQLALEQQNNALEKSLLKLENLRSQMNPHFVFNALNSIQDYILTNEKDLAGDYLGQFSDLIRMYLDQSVKKTITLKEEIETLSQYLELEKLRFEDKLFYKIEVDKDINTETIELPTMLVQPYVENALKHGLLHKTDVGHLTLYFDLAVNENLLLCTIEDDGVGREKAQKIKDKRGGKHVSFATKATEQRLDLLNYGKRQKIIVSIEDLYFNNTPRGTRVILKVPLNKD